MVGPFNVPYLVGDVYQRDHQFWPTFVDAAERFTDITLETLMQAAWRAREWTVSAGNFSFNGINPSTSQPWSMTGTWDEFKVTMKRHSPTFGIDGTYRDVTDERDILGPSDSSFISPTPHTLLNSGVFGTTPLTSSSYQEPSPGPSITPFGMVRGDILGDRIAFNVTTKEFNPMSGTYATGFFTFPAAAPRAEVSFGLKEGGAGSFKLFNSVVDPVDPIIESGMQVIGRHTAGPPNEGSGTVSDIIMRATKWWPFSNSLGQTIYDPDTGLPTGADPFA